MAANNTGNRKKTNTGSGRSTAAKKRPQTKPQNKARQSTKKQTRQPIEHNPYDRELVKEIQLLVSIAITVIFTISNFGACGLIGNIISDFMFGCFGILAYVLPIVTFLGIWFLIANISNSKAIVKFIAGTVSIIDLCAFMELVSSGDSQNSLTRIYTECGKHKTGGGIFGGIISNGLCSSVSIYGAYIIIILVMIIAFIVITEKSVIGGVKHTSMKMYDAAKDDYNRLREESADYIKEKQYRKNRRINQKAKGVGDTLVGNPDRVSEDIHEITDIHHKSVYRGHVDIDENIDKVHEAEENYQQENEQEEPLREVYIKGYEAPKKNVDEKPVNMNTYEQEDKDENEPFVPKEKIVVSESAMNVMRQKPFSGAEIAKAAEPVQASRTIVKKAEAKPEAEPKTSGKSLKYTFPPVSLLTKGTLKKPQGGRRGGLSETAMKLQQILENFGVNATVTNESHGPSVTRYELQPEMGTKVSKITSLTDDIKLNLAAADIRIEAPIPGKAAVGIEVPNETRDSVLLRDLIESEELKKHPSKIAFAAGMDIAGNVIVADIAKMPHMLIAGTTGSGKSVFTNSIIMSILFRADPNEVKLIIVDPKVVEFGVYNGIPHLLIPVVTDPKKAAGALNWAVGEMSKRYKMFADYNVRDLKGYNEKIKDVEVEEGEERPEKLPQIVIIIDELADLMMVAAKEVEESICRLAQLARAAGIHLIIATQRPSVDVVTGLIKANVPSRVALLVSSGTDSRTIIDMNGAEKLLGNGDMLFYPSGYVKPVRLQGAFVSDSEVSKVVDFLISHTETVTYDENIAKQMAAAPAENSSSGGAQQSGDDGNDQYFEEAGKFVIEKDKASTSMLQRMFKIGFNRAARIMDQLCEAGVVGEEEGTKPRKVLMTLNEFETYLQNKNTDGGNE